MANVGWGMLNVECGRLDVGSSLFLCSKCSKCSNIQSVQMFEEFKCSITHIYILQFAIFILQL
jgi:hypothetical protein